MRTVRMAEPTEQSTTCLSAPGRTFDSQTDKTISDIDKRSAYVKERLRTKEDWLEKALDYSFRKRLRQEVEGVAEQARY